MQNLTLKIPENKLFFFLELINILGFVKVEKQETPATILSQEQIKQIEEERNKIKNNPDYLLDWKEARKSLNSFNAQVNFNHSK
ncbi:MAG TPA: hypothetical protein PKX92_01450 [Edaphocola sp.]|nr:hypothetical protein [Edaphocola sp.]